MAAEDWENDFETILSLFITLANLSSLISSLTMQSEIENPSEIQELGLLLQEVIARYYSFNTYTGCTNPGAPSFDYQANSEAPGSCLAPAANYTFGGVFQECTGGNALCDKLMQKNPLTGNYRCPSEFRAHGLGAVLSHKMLDGSEKPIGYVSRTLNPSGCNFSQLEK